jgi:HK97 family phage major capsid protein
MRRDDIRRLTEQRKSVFAQMQQLNEGAEKENRSLRADEQEQFDKMANEFDDLKDREERATRLFIQEREVEKVAATPIEKRIGDDGDAPATLGEYRERLHGSRAWDEPEVRSAYWKYLTVGNLAELDVEEQRALSRATGAAGNYLVPTDFYNQIIRAIRFTGSFGALANVVTTDNGDQLQVPANTAHGTASWTAENASFTASDETFNQVTLGAFKASTSIIVSEELLQDSAFPLDAFLANEFGERIGILEENSWINGSGTGQPQGVLANLTTVFTAATGNATTFNYTALVSGIFTLPAQYRQNASFVVNDAAARNLYLMTDTQNRPLWNVNVATTGPDTFLGFPIYTHPNMPAPAAGTKSMMFGDWRRVYTVRRVAGFSLQRQNELYSNNGQVGFRGQERVDGRVILDTAGVALAHSAT